MVLRYCPSCKAKLSSFDFHFCTKCGESLDASVVKKSEAIKEKLHSYVDDDTLDRSKYGLEVIKKVAPILVIVAVLIIPFLLIKFPAIVTKEPEVPEAVLEKEEPCEGKLPCIKFGGNMIADYVPHDSDIYLELGDFGEFSDIYLNKYPERNPLIKALESMNVRHIALFISAEEENQIWSLVAITSVDLSIELMKILDESNDIFGAKLEGAFVITDNRDALESIRNAKEKNIKSLSLNPKYAVVKTQIPSEGELLFLVLSEEGDKIVNEIEWPFATSDEKFFVR